MVPTKQTNLWVAEWSSFAAATVFIILRLVSRKLTRVGLWWDDYFAIACYVCIPYLNEACLINNSSVPSHGLL